MRIASQEKLEKNLIHEQIVQEHSWSEVSQIQFKSLKVIRNQEVGVESDSFGKTVALGTEHML